MRIAYTVAGVLPDTGAIPVVGRTMTDEREREIVRSSALRNMHKYGLESKDENLPEYFRRVREELG